MRFALYLTILIALLPLVFTRPFVGLCVYYVVSLLQPKILCWEPEFQDALLVGVPLIIGAIAFGVIRREVVPNRELATGKLIGLEHKFAGVSLIQPCWPILLFAALILYVGVTRLFVPFSLENNSYQFRSLCKVLLVAALMTGIVTSPKQFKILFIVIALSTAFWAVKGGLKVMLLGPHQVYGKTYDNNLFALTSVMTLPMVFYYGLTVKHARWRTLLLICSALICLGIIGSRSRAGFAAFAVVLFCMAWSSKYRVRALVAVSVVAALTAVMSGHEIWERAQSIFAYEQDKSARSRFATWEAAWQLFLGSPAIGVGFNNFELAKDALTGGQKSAHNIFLQNLSELGALGSPIWLAIIFGTMLGLYRLMRRARVLPPDMRWVYYCARGLLLGMLAFCIHGFFHNEEYIELMFVLVALAATLRIVADRQWREVKLEQELARTAQSDVQPSPGGEPRLDVPKKPAARTEKSPARPRSLGALARYGLSFKTNPGS